MGSEMCIRDRFVTKLTFMDGEIRMVYIDAEQSLLIPKIIYDIALIGYPAFIAGSPKETYLLARDENREKMLIIKFDIDTGYYEIVKEITSDVIRDILATEIIIQYLYKDDKLTLYTFNVNEGGKAYLIDKDGNLINSVNCHTTTYSFVYIIDTGYIVVLNELLSGYAYYYGYAIRIINLWTNKVFTIEEEASYVNTVSVFIPVYKLGSNIIAMMPYKGTMKIIIYSFEKDEIVKAIEIVYPETEKFYVTTSMIDNIMFYSAYLIPEESTTIYGLCAFDLIGGESMCYDLFMSPELEKVWDVTYLTFDGKILILFNTSSKDVCLVKFTRIGKINAYASPILDILIRYYWQFVGV